ncbi:MAG: LEPR-XLL domain-containing protein, partial [Candidatus Accumulibacter sp.]|nr:LEPR-XLL domain-containing protein [Accumulibacter sp.]
MPPFARKLFFESLEPRVLLSADLAPTASALMPESRTDNQSALSSTIVSLSDAPGTSDLAIVQITGQLKTEVLEKGSGPADQGQLNLVKQGEVISQSAAAAERDPKPYPWLGVASGHEVAPGENDGRGTGTLIGRQESLVAGTYYVQVLPLGDGATSGQDQMRVEGTHAVPQGQDAQEPTTNMVTSAGQAAATASAAAPAAVVLAHWVGGSGNWSDPTNWDIGVAPNNTASESYDVVLDGAGTPTITLDQDVVIRSLNNAATLLVDGVRATVEQASSLSGVISLDGATAQLTLSGTVDVSGEIQADAGMLNLIDATVTVDGAGARVIADRAVALDAVDLHAIHGGVLSLLGAASFNNSSGGNSIDASGVGSKVDLSGLNTFTGGAASATQIAASSGGAVALAGAISGSTVISMADATSILDVAGVTSLSDTSVSLSNGATATFSGLTELTRVSLDASGGSQLLFPMATEYINGVRGS